MFYLIYPDEDSDLYINENDLLQRINSNWDKYAVIHELRGGDSKNAVLTWSIHSDSEDLYGYLHSDRKTIAVEGAVNSIIEFTLWYRSIIPEGTHLYFSGDDDEKEKEIHIETTKNMLEMHIFRNRNE